MNEYEKPTIELVLKLLAEADGINNVLNIVLQKTVDEISEELFFELQKFEKNGTIDLNQKIDLSQHPKIFILIKRLEDTIIQKLDEYAWIAMSASGESLTSSYKTTVASTYEILGKPMGKPYQETMINDTYIKETVLKVPWCQDGKVYSQRLYANVANFEQKLAFVLEEGITKGKGMEWMKQAWRKLTGAAMYDTARLLKTETMAMWSLATKTSYLDMGVKYVKISNPDPCHGICVDYNKNEPILLSEAIIGDLLPPYHPNCACLYYAYDVPQESTATPDYIYTGTQSVEG